MPEPPLYNPIGIPFIELQSIDSTNNYALDRVHAGLAQHGAAFFAHEQLAGRGQRGKIWLAEKDSNLILSVILNPEPLDVSQQFQLSACVAVSVTEFFSRYAGVETRIKWPNDIYWQDRKAGGVLIENVLRGSREFGDGSRETGVGSRESGVGGRETGDGSRESGDGSQESGDESRETGVRSRETGVASWRWAVVGVGLNINQGSFPEALKNPVSLRQITGRSFNTIELARELCTLLQYNWHILVNQGFEPIYSSYLRSLYKIGETVRLKNGSRVFEAFIKTVSTDGALIVEHAIEERFVSGELEWLPPGS